jgi:1,5-anhydro-D-fructose reductase (1,5-anhydro-D-mannitol-forming)
VERTLKVAILGFWHVHATGYAEMIRDHPGTELVAIWDQDPARGEEAGQQWGVPYYEDLDLLLGGDVDAVVVTAATVDHERVVVRSAQAGKHVFVEKLLGTTADEIDRILNATDDAGIALTVALPRLYESYTRAIDRLAAEGKYGDLTYVRVRLAHDGSIRDWLPKRFYDPAEAVGGSFTDLGCHPVYLVDHFFGQRPTLVSAVYGQMTGRGVDDNSVVTFRYENGAVGVAESGFVTPGHSPFTIELHWNQASLYYGHLGDVFELWEDGQRRLLEPSEAAAPTPLEQWVEHIRRGTTDRDNIIAARNLTDLVVLANESAATGRQVTGPLSE